MPGPPKSETPAVSVATRLTPHVIDELDRIAKDVRLSRGNVVSLLVLHALGHEADIPVLRELRALRKGGTHE